MLEPLFLDGYCYSAAAQNQLKSTTSYIYNLDDSYKVKSGISNFYILQLTNLNCLAFTASYFPVNC